MSSPKTKSPETGKSSQVDLETLISKTPKQPQRELHDAFTGVAFQPRTRNHYEELDPKPFAPNLQIARPTVRQRIENLLQRGIDPLQDYVRQQQETDNLEFDVPDDPEAPLTHGERMALDQVASDLAEKAPLPDEGLPRPAPSGGEGGGAPSPEAAPKAASTPPSGVAGSTGTKP